MFENSEILSLTKDTWTKIFSDVRNVGAFFILDPANNEEPTEYRIAIVGVEDSPPAKDYKGGIIVKESYFVNFDSDVDIYCFPENYDGSIVKLPNMGKDAISSILSNSKDALIATTFEDDYANQGKRHEISLTLSIPRTTPYYMALDLTGVSSDKRVFVLPVIFSASQGSVKIRTYDTVSYVGGTEDIEILDGNEIENDTSEAVFKYNLTSVNGATKIRNYLLGSSGNRVTSRGGSTSASKPLQVGKIIKIVEIINEYTDAVDFNMNLAWFEI